MEKKLIWTGIVIGTILALVGIFRLTFVDFVDNHEFGYKFDRRSGEVTVLKEKGYFVTPPYVVKVYHIDLRPMQVCINANNRVLNCKLVQFDTSGFTTFIKWHGVGDYEQTSSNSPGTGSLSDILMSYAYDPSRKHIPFLKVKKELKSDDYNDETNDEINLVQKQDSTISNK